MTLTDYLNQKDPQRMPNVVLKKHELIIANTRTTIMGDKTSRVYINHDNPLVAGTEYCLIGSRLYTVDRDGNARNPSCFRVGF
jgi:hypothetical protein